MNKFWDYEKRKEKISRNKNQQNSEIKTKNFEQTKSMIYLQYSNLKLPEISLKTEKKGANVHKIVLIIWSPIWI